MTFIDSFDIERERRPVDSIKFSPFGFEERIKGKVPTSIPDKKLLSYRSPTVHLCISDFNNTKVKDIAESFEAMMKSCNINVFREEYQTHQSGTSVDGKSIDTKGDFFVSLRSNTAKLNQLVVHCGKLKTKLHPEEAVQEIWSWWRVRCGALTQEEINCLSPEKITVLLETFTGMTNLMSMITNIQQKMKEKQDESKILPLIESGYRYIEQGNAKIAEFKEMDTTWNNIQGRRVSRMIPVDAVVGISQPLKQFLVSFLRQIKRKLDGLKNLCDLRPNTRPERTLHESSWDHMLGDMSDVD